MPVGGLAGPARAGRDGDDFRPERAAQGACRGASLGHRRAGRRQRARGRGARRAAGGLYRRLGRTAVVRGIRRARLVHGDGQGRGHAAGARTRGLARRRLPLRAGASLARRRKRGLRGPCGREPCLAPARDAGVRLRSRLRACGHGADLRRARPGRKAPHQPPRRCLCKAGRRAVRLRPSTAPAVQKAFAPHTLPAGQ